MSPEFSLPEFLSWCRTKPADEEYEYIDAPLCALGQFGTATDRQYLHRCYDPNKELRIEGLNDALFNAPFTFGALVKRLEKLCPEMPDYARIEAYLVDLESVGA